MSNQIARIKHLSFYLIMIGLTTAASFALLEYGLARYYHSTESQVSHTIFDPTIGWRLRPGTYWVKPSHTFRPHQVHINEYGLLNARIAAEAERDIKRLIILGDSFTFGMAIPSEDTFPTLLGTLLNRRGHYEVLNAGVPGYGTAQEMLLMKDLVGKNIVGNVYVLMIFINDILDNLRLGEYGTLAETPAQPGFALGQHGELTLTHYPEKTYSTHFVPPNGARFFTLQVLRSRITALLQTKPNWVRFLNGFGVDAKLWRMPSLIYGWYPEEPLGRGVPLTKALIKEIREEARRNHGLLLISLIPSPFQVYPDVYGPVLRKTFPDNALVESYFADPTRPQRIISRICEELDIPLLDLLPILVRNNDKELFLPSDGHFSRDGHAIVAQHLARFIEDRSSRNVAR